MADGNAIVIPQVRIGTPLVEDWAYLARAMREEERAEVAAITGRPYSADAAAQTFITVQGLKYVLVGRDNLPLAAGCFEHVRPGVLETWGIGTPEAWGSAWRTITKVCRRQMDELFETGTHRIQIVSGADRAQAHAWYERGLLMQREGVLHRYFADGSDAVMHARVRGE